MSTTINANAALTGFFHAPWPWTLKEVGKAHNPVFYIRDADDREVARLDGPNARQRAELFMELAARHQQRQQYNEKYGLPVKQLV